MNKKLRSEVLGTITALLITATLLLGPFVYVFVDELISGEERPRSSEFLDAEFQQYVEDRGERFDDWMRQVDTRDGY
jgi:hypothetical protein